MVGDKGRHLQDTQTHRQATHRDTDLHSHTDLQANTNMHTHAPGLCRANVRNTGIDTFTHTHTATSSLVHIIAWS